MKTSFFSLLVMLTICLLSNSANASTLQATDSITNKSHEMNSEEGGIFKFKIHYVRGHRNEEGKCVDRGVCEFDIEIGFRVVNPGDLIGELRRDSYDNILLVIEKNGTTPESAIDITGFATGPGIFQLSNDSDVPEQVKTEFGLPANYQFKAGSYQVTETATNYMVNFRK